MQIEITNEKGTSLIKTSLKLTANITFNRATLDSEVEIK